LRLGVRRWEVVSEDRRTGVVDVLSQLGHKACDTESFGFRELFARRA
jgi:hypothetical protein